MEYSITKGGIALDKSLYTLDEETKTFSSNVNGLVLDFSNEDNCTFDTGYKCIFKTGPGCTFDTSSGCTFDTGSGCIFKTGPDCTFKAGSDCTFDTSYRCIFKAGSGCTFDTSFDCIFDTDSDCTFDTGFNSVVVRRDVYEVIELEEGVGIKLNGYGIKGFTKVDDSESIEIDDKTYTLDQLKKALKLIEEDK